MGSYVFSFKAKEDLRRIWQYSVEKFGLDQAEKYYNELEETFSAISNNEKWNSPIEKPGGGYRQTYFRAHRIIFKFESEDLVVIMRVLGQQMDLTRHL